MSPVRIRSLLCTAGVASLLGAGCVKTDDHSDFRSVGYHAQPSAGAGLAVSWTRDLAPPQSGSYIPVEQASPGFDRDGERVYVGSTRGALFALEGSRGGNVFRYDAKASVEAQPVVDGARNELYVATIAGSLLALRADDASLRWRADIGASVSQAPLLSADAVYIVTDSDTVSAVARTDGAILWRYHRDPREGFAIAGHAGLTQSNGRLLTGFADGTVVALDASDGRALWDADTSVDLEEVDPARRFTDVDTTPAVVGNTVYAASFSGGLYAIDMASGSTQLHLAELRGVTAISASEDALIVSSAELGVVCLDLPNLGLRWRHKIDRGSPGKAQLRGNNVYVAESRGALLALALANGQEVGRLETGHGITAPATLDGGRGYVVSNAGKLYAFTY